MGTLRHKCYIFALGTFYSIPTFSWSIAALKYFHLFLEILGNSTALFVCHMSCSADVVLLWHFCVGVSYSGAWFSKELLTDKF